MSDFKPIKAPKRTPRSPLPFNDNPPTDAETDGGRDRGCGGEHLAQIEEGGGRYKKSYFGASLYWQLRKLKPRWRFYAKKEGHLV